MLGLGALGVRRRWQAAAAAVVVAGFALIVLFSAQFGADVRPSPTLFGPIDAPKWDFPGSEIVFDVFAAGGATVVGFAVRRLWRDEAGEPDERRAWLGLRRRCSAAWRQGPRTQCSWCCGWCWSRWRITR